MMLLDSDVLLLDLRYPNDARFGINRQVLQHLQANAIVIGITAQALLEVVGILSFNLSAGRVAQLPLHLSAQFRLTVFPDIQQHPDYAGCTVGEIIAQMGNQMALGDAVQAVQIARHASFADGLLTWNARHFQGKLVVPVLTPQEWLNQQFGGTP